MFPTTSTFRALRHHNYRLWAGADIVSVTGTWMQVLGVNWLILTLTGSATSVGLSLVMRALPTLLLGMWGGALADRLPTRPVVAAAQLAQAGLAVVLAVIAFSDVRSVVPIYAVALAGGVVGALGGPALGRFGAEVVPPADLPNAMALGSILNSAGRILGMSLAGALLPLTGMGGLFVVNAVSFFFVLAAMAAMRRAEFHVLAAATRQPGAVLEGLRYVLRTPWLLAVLALWFVSGSVGRNFQVTMASMSAGPLEAGAGGYGLLSTVFAVGTVLGGFLAATRPRLTLRLLLITAFVTGVAQALSGMMPSLWTFAAMMLPIAAGAVALDTTVNARAQLDSPDEMRGRVIAALSIVSAGAGAVGGPLLGWLSDTLGPRVALEIGGVSCVAAALLTAVALARLSGRTVRQAVRVRRPSLENA
ncbi:transporter, putative [[Actinomadura] parvosata subsp. kistnae]|uniref:MFS transporter n=1 Tax=[Actinomadura] parvosata subsp. kistnae TaxID=1909395 RepID=A0A1U9ZQC0_9ACTN|nr:MFS transporter [Nonomuraea sp. ATCC 55076]AQZ60136.1 MFS transporter [Nonomuraea sp. ATCC 55076]SPL91406.1 transporter, putative [Actinomadura parvosata subsp. kistnae]